MEYALKYGDHLKGAIISSMVDNIPEYMVHINKVRDETLPVEAVSYMKRCEAEGNYDDPQYQAYVDVLNAGYVDRRQPLAIRHLISTMATPVYNAFQGDNEFVVTGKLKDFDLRKEIHNITVPTLLTFGQHETMPLSSALRMSQEIPNARLETTPNGGHHHMMDNPDVYFAHLKQFILDVESGHFKA